MAEMKSANIGIVALETKHAIEGPSGEQEGGSTQPPWTFTSPDHLPYPSSTKIAYGASPSATLAGDSQATDAVAKAVRDLEHDSQVIMGNCGFFYAAWPTVRNQATTPTVLSSLDLLDVVLAMTSQPVGIITYSRPCLERILSIHPLYKRLRIVGLDDLPDWSVLKHPDYMERGGWTENGLREQLTSRVAEAFTNGGTLEDVTILILECTVLPHFRPALRTVTHLPIVDILAFTKALVA